MTMMEMVEMEKVTSPWEFSITLKMQHEDTKYILAYSPQEAIKHISWHMDIKKMKNYPSAAMSAWGSASVMIITPILYSRVESPFFGKMLIDYMRLWAEKQGEQGNEGSIKSGG